MKTVPVILFYLLFIIGCNSKGSAPRGIIAGKKMEMIMWDMIKADEYFTTIGLVNDTSQERRSERINMYSKIFQIHNITKEEFQKSFSFYRTHPVLLKKMMDSIGVNRRDISSEQKAPMPGSDSFPFRKRILPKLP